MAASRSSLAALLLLALLVACATGASAWRKGGFIPDEFVGTWKCTQRNHTRPEGGGADNPLGEPVKKMGTVGYSGAALWLVRDHEVRTPGFHAGTSTQFVRLLA